MPPPGFGYVPDPVHGHVLVPLASAAPPPRGRVARNYAPRPGVGYGPAAGDPIQHAPDQNGRRLVLVPGGRSDVLVRGLMDKDGVARDPWAERLAEVPELAVDADVREEVTAHLDAQVARPVMLDPNSAAHDDPAGDAFGGSNMQSHRIPSAAGPSGG